jgi:quinol monooxygenase YgiN
MYLHVELKNVPPNRQTEAIDRLSRLHELMAATPGFRDAQICAYLGNPSKYLVTRTWEDASAHAGYRASEAAEEFAQSRPAVLPWENTAVQEWETILTAEGHSSGDLVVRSLYTVEEAGRQAFLDSRTSHETSRAHAGGLVYSRIYRPLKNEEDAQSDLLVLERYADRGSYNRYLEGPGRAEYEREMQPALRQPSLIECYEVLVETAASEP